MSELKSLTSRFPRKVRLESLPVATPLKVARPCSEKASSGGPFNAVMTGCHSWRLVVLANTFRLEVDDKMPDART